MAWVAIDDQFPEHDKVADLSDRAFRIHVVALCYCARNLTDGVLDTRSVKVICAIVNAARPQRYLDELVNAGLWLHIDRGGYEIKNYLEFNPSRDKVEENKAKARERMKRLRAGERSGERAGERTANVREMFGDPLPSPVSSKEPSPTRDAARPEGAFASEVGKGLLITRLVAAMGGGEQNRRKIDNALRRHSITEADLVATIDAVTSPKTQDRVAIALTELSKRRKRRAA